ncbi:transcriptional coactivator ADA2 [Plasmodium sp. gorilla clade G3]|nr:transcriptional coactivator ADA2 [Plasmodium sp. gorilla clade G3]
MNINKYEGFYPSILMHERQCGLSGAYIVYEKGQLEILEQEVLKAIIIKALIIEEVIKYIKYVLYKIELIKYDNNNYNNNTIITSYNNTDIRKNQIKDVYYSKLVNKNKNIIYNNNLIKDVDHHNFKNKLYIIQFNDNKSIRRDFFKTKEKNIISNDNIRIQGNDVIENKNEKINKSLCNIISNENKETILNNKNLDTIMLLEKIKRKAISFINKSSYVIIYKSINNYNNVLQKELIDILLKCCNSKYQLYSKNINSYSIIYYVIGHINKMKEYQMKNEFSDDIIVKIKDELNINIDLIYKNNNNKSFLSVMENINYAIVNTYNINQDKLESFRYLHFNFFYICSELENKQICSINKYNKVNNNIYNIFLKFVTLFFHLYIQNSGDKRKGDICNNFYNILKYNSYNYEKFYVFILLCNNCIVSIRNDKLIYFVLHNGRKRFSNDGNKELYKDNSIEKKMTIRICYYFKFNINKKSVHNRNYYFLNYAHDVIFNHLDYFIVKGCSKYYKIQKSKEFKRNTYNNNNNKNNHWTNYFNYIQLYNKCKKINNKYRKMKIIDEIILTKNFKYENNNMNKKGNEKLSGTYFLFNNNKKRNFFIVYYKRYIKRGYDNSGNNKEKMFCFKNDNIVLLNKIILYLIDKNRKDVIKKDKLNIKEWNKNTKLYCNSNNAEGGDGGYNNHSNSNYRNNSNNNIGNYNNNGSNFFGNNMGGNNNDNDDNDNNDENNYKPKNTCNDDDNDNEGENKNNSGKYNNSVNKNDNNNNNNNMDDIYGNNVDNVNNVMMNHYSDKISVSNENVYDNNSNVIHKKMVDNKLEGINKNASNNNMINNKVMNSAGMMSSNGDMNYNLNYMNYMNNTNNINMAGSGGGSGVNRMTTVPINHVMNFPNSYMGGANIPSQVPQNMNYDSIENMHDMKQTPQQIKHKTGQLNSSINHGDINNNAKQVGGLPSNFMQNQMQQQYQYQQQVHMQQLVQQQNVHGYNNMMQSNNQQKFPNQSGAHKQSNASILKMPPFSSLNAGDQRSSYSIAQKLPRHVMDTNNNVPSINNNNISSNNNNNNPRNSSSNMPSLNNPNQFNSVSMKFPYKGSSPQPLNSINNNNNNNPNQPNNMPNISAQQNMQNVNNNNNNNPSVVQQMNVNHPIMQHNMIQQNQNNMHNLAPNKPNESQPMFPLGGSSNQQGNIQNLASPNKQKMQQLFQQGGQQIIASNQKGINTANISGSISRQPNQGTGQIPISHQNIQQFYHNNSGQIFQQQPPFLQRVSTTPQHVPQQQVPYEWMSNPYMHHQYMLQQCQLTPQQLFMHQQKQQQQQLQHQQIQQQQLHQQQIQQQQLHQQQIQQQQLHQQQIQQQQLHQQQIQQQQLQQHQGNIPPLSARQSKQGILQMQSQNNISHLPPNVEQHFQQQNISELQQHQQQMQNISAQHSSISTFKPNAQQLMYPGEMFKDSSILQGEHNFEIMDGVNEMQRTNDAFKGGNVIEASNVSMEAITEEDIFDSNYHCDICNKDITHTIRIRCAECVDFDLCVNCFSTGKEMKSDKCEHYNYHNYIPIPKYDFPLYKLNWSAEEELLLLDGISKFGFGNWEQVADLVNSVANITKTDRECESHYYNYYLKSNCAPLPDNKRLLIKPDGNPYEIEHVVEKDINDNDDYVLPKSKKNNRTQIIGYWPLRGDFDIEYDNDAELLLADMEFKESDLPQQKELKLQVLEIYNSKLDERIYRKRTVIERGLLDSKAQMQKEKKRTKEEKELYAALKPLSRFHSPQHHEYFIQLLLEEQKLRQRLTKLQEWKALGLQNIEQVQEYEIEKNRRAKEMVKQESNSTTGIITMNNISSSNNNNNTVTTEKLGKSLKTSKKDYKIKNKVEETDENKKLNIDTFVALDLLNEKEVEFCKNMKLPILFFLLIKRLLIMEVSNSNLNMLKDINELKLKGYKVGQLYDFFLSFDINQKDEFLNNGTINTSYLKKNDGKRKKLKNNFDITNSKEIDGKEKLVVDDKDEKNDKNSSNHNNNNTNNNNNNNNNNNANVDNYNIYVENNNNSIADNNIGNYSMMTLQGEVIDENEKKGKSKNEYKSKTSNLTNKNSNKGYSKLKSPPKDDMNDIEEDAKDIIIKNANDIILTECVNDKNMQSIFVDNNLESENNDQLKEREVNCDELNLTEKELNEHILNTVIVDENDKKGKDKKGKNCGAQKNMDSNSIQNEVDMKSNESLFNGKKKGSIKRKSSIINNVYDKEHENNENVNILENEVKDNITVDDINENKEIPNGITETFESIDHIEEDKDMTMKDIKNDNDANNHESKDDTKNDCDDEKDDDDYVVQEEILDDDKKRKKKKKEKKSEYADNKNDELSSIKINENECTSNDIEEDIKSIKSLRKKSYEKIKGVTAHLKTNNNNKKKTNDNFEDIEKETTVSVNIIDSNNRKAKKKTPEKVETNNYQSHVEPLENNSKKKNTKMRKTSEYSVTRNESKNNNNSDVYNDNSITKDDSNIDLDDKPSKNKKSISSTSTVILNKNEKGKRTKLTKERATVDITSNLDTKENDKKMKNFEANLKKKAKKRKGSVSLILNPKKSLKL